MTNTRKKLIEFSNFDFRLGFDDTHQSDAWILSFTMSADATINPQCFNEQVQDLQQVNKSLYADFDWGHQSISFSRTILSSETQPKIEDLAEIENKWTLCRQEILSTFMNKLRFSIPKSIVQRFDNDTIWRIKNGTTLVQPVALVSDINYASIIKKFSNFNPKKFGSFFDKKEKFLNKGFHLGNEMVLVQVIARLPNLDDTEQDEFDPDFNGKTRASVGSLRWIKFLHFDRFDFVNFTRYVSILNDIAANLGSI